MVDIVAEASHSGDVSVCHRKRLRRRPVRSRLVLGGRDERGSNSNQTRTDRVPLEPNGLDADVPGIAAAVHTAALHHLQFGHKLLVL